MPNPSDIFTVPASEVDRRIASIQPLMQQDRLDAILVIQRTDLFYFSGTAQNGLLFIPAQGAPLLFVRRYLPRARLESPLANIIGIGSLKQVPDLIQEHHGGLPDVIGLELDVIPVNEFEFYRSLLKPCRCKDASHAILEVRKLKSDWEIAQMAHTAECSRRTFAYMRRILRPGLTEMEFAGMFETFARQLGHGAQLQVRNYQALGYPWHVLSGASGGMVGLLDSPASGQGSSAAFPCGAGPKKLVPGEPIMVDMGFVCNGYHMDETRMFAIDSLPDKAARASQVAIDIHDAVIAECRPGIRAATLYEDAVKYAADQGYADQFLGPPNHKVRFIGHGIGLELIEPPFIAQGKQDRLRPGMTLAIEPKMVFEGEYAVGIESVVQITSSGSHLLSQIPVQHFVC
jgi:Xaa-Pro aminopeptidase